MHETENEIISGLPKSMRSQVSVSPGMSNLHGDEVLTLSAGQVVLNLYKEALSKVPIFKGQNASFAGAFVTHLKLEYYSPGRAD